MQRKEKEISRGKYESQKRKLEKNIEKIEIEIIVRSGTERQLTLLENMRKAYKEEIISRKMYIKSREKLVNKIIRREGKRFGKKKKKS